MFGKFWKKYSWAVKKAILEIKETTILKLYLDDQSNYFPNFIFPPYCLRKMDSHVFGSCFFNIFLLFQFPFFSLDLDIVRYSPRLPIRINRKVCLESKLSLSIDKQLLVMNIAIQGKAVSCEILGHLFTWTHTLKFFPCHHTLLGDLRAFWVSCHCYFLLSIICRPAVFAYFFSGLLRT